MSRILLLALLAAALAATIGWELQPPAVPEPAGVPHRPPAASPHAAPAADAATAAQGWMATALERPLFRENRRPDKAASDVAVRADGPMRLTGVITGPSGNNTIFMAPGDARPLVVSEGMQVGDFVIRSIKPGHVVVEADGTLKTLTPAFAQAHTARATN